MKCCKCNGLMYFNDFDGTSIAECSAWRCINCGHRTYTDKNQEEAIQFPLKISRDITAQEYCYLCKKAIKDISYNRNHHVFCSRECKRSYEGQKRSTLCAVCGITIINHYHRKTCSKKCNDILKSRGLEFTP